MAKQINPVWVDRMRKLLSADQAVDETVGFNPAAQWLVMGLSRRARWFRVYQLGAGVKRITTQTDRCPCCKRLLAAGSGNTKEGK